MGNDVLCISVCRCGILSENPSKLRDVECSNIIWHGFLC